MSPGRAAPPPRLTRAEAKAETRKRVLAAADIVFRRDGYHGASLERVALEAGFTKGAVYSAFESKADLFFVLLEQRASGRRADIEETLADSSSAEDFVATVVERFARSATRERDWWTAVIEFMTVVGRDEGLRKRFADHHDASRDAIAAAVEEAARRSSVEIALDPQHVGTMVMALNNGLTLEWLLSPLDVPVQTYVDAQLALLRGASVTRSEWPARA